MKIELSDEVKEYMIKRKTYSILLEYMPPCSLCSGSVGHLVAHLVTIRDRNKLKDHFTSIIIDACEIIVPNEMMGKSLIRLKFKRALFSDKGSVQVTFEE